MTRRRVGLGVRAFVFGVLTVAAGVLLAVYIYFALLLPAFITQTTTVETREVPVEETVVQMASMVRHTSSEVLLTPGQPVEIDLGPGVYEVSGGDIDHSISLGSTTHATGASWAGPRQILSVVEAPAAEIRDVDSAGLVMPYGPMVLSSSAIKEPRTLTFRRVWCPEDFG
ncbi:MAG: hypothetical protein OXG64_07270 [Chloroflexi bacterium]|nr:hypothetical protein [Chloroflexota bacterium]